MKKLIHISLIALTFAFIDTVDAKIMHKKTTSSPMNMQSSARQISEATDALKDAVKDIQSAPANEKAMARQEANDAVAHVLATLHERTWAGDLRGYSEEQIKAAGKKLELLYAEEKNLDNQIKAQQLKIDEITDKGWLWNAAKESKKEEHKEASTELANLQNKHTKVKSAIRSEEVVAGKAYALSIKRAVYVISAAAAAGTAYAIDAYYFDSKGKAYLSKQFEKAYSKLPNVPYFGAEARHDREWRAREIEKQNAILHSAETAEAAPKQPGRRTLTSFGLTKTVPITLDDLKNDANDWAALESEWYSRRAAGADTSGPEMQELARTVTGAKAIMVIEGTNLVEAGIIDSEQRYNIWENANKEVVENLTNAGIEVTNLNILNTAGITKKEADAMTAKATAQSRLATAKARQVRTAKAEAKRRSPRQ